MTVHRYFRALLMGLAAMPASAFATTLECSVNPGTSNNGWVSDRYQIVIDAGTGGAKVDDGVIEYYAKKPVDGVVTRSTDKHVVVAWRFDVVSDTGKRFRMEYRGTFFRDTGRFALYAKPPSYVETYSAQGSCLER